MENQPTPLAVMPSYPCTFALASDLLLSKKIPEGRLHNAVPFGDYLFLFNNRQQPCCIAHANPKLFLALLQFFNHVL